MAGEAKLDDRVLPDLTWRELQESLSELAQSPVQALMVGHLVEGLRRDTKLLTPAGLLRELAVITTAVIDPSFPCSSDPSSSDGEAAMH